MGARSPHLGKSAGDDSWSVLDAVPDGTVIVSANGEIVYVNDQGAAMLGYEPDALVGRPVEDLLPVALRSQHRSHRARYSAHPVARPMGAGLVLHARRADGFEVPVEISLKPLQLGDEAFVVAAVRDISSRLATEAELRASREALFDAERTLAVADDRERIARDLHDSVIQRLFAAGLRLEAATAVADEPVRERLAATVQDLDETIKELRMAIFSLQGRGRAPGGLRGQLLEVVTDGARTLGFDPRLQFDGPIETIGEDVAAQLVPILREALSNIAQHAQASECRIELAVSDGIVLRVTDDGVGVPDEVLGGRGLANMAQRAQAMGGTFSVAPGPKGGTELEWRVPRPAGASR